MKTTFKDFIYSLFPANQPLNYMEIKEMSERMELSRQEARKAWQCYIRAKNHYHAACRIYECRLGKVSKRKA